MRGTFKALAPDHGAMVAPVVVRTRTANLPQFQLTPKETVFLVSSVAFVNLVLGFVLGFFV